MTFIEQASKEFNMESPFALCEKTVQHCIDAVEAQVNDRFGEQSAYAAGLYRAKKEAIRALESLLPKKDRAKELVEAWMAQRGRSSSIDGYAVDFANYLISNNLINEKGAL